MKLEFPWQIFDQTSNFMNMRPVGAEPAIPFRHTDKRKWQLIVAFRNFANVPRDFT